MPRPKSLKVSPNNKTKQEMGSGDQSKLGTKNPTVQGSKVPTRAGVNKPQKGMRSSVSSQPGSGVPKETGSVVLTVQGSVVPSSKVGSGVPIFYKQDGSPDLESKISPSRETAAQTSKDQKDPAKILALKRRLILKALAEASFYEYVKQAWHSIETVPFRDGRHIRAICQVLQDISEGRLSDTVINMPPRHMKSLLVSVFWPTWEWISKPGEKFLCVSYDKALAEELGNKARKVILSEWYQQNWGHIYQLSPDQNAKHSYTNDKNGARISIQMGGNITGKGGSRLILDDPNDPSASASERAETLKFFTEKLQSRLNDPTNPSLVVQQRTAEDDITGFILLNKTEEHPVTHVCLAAEYEIDRPNPYDWRILAGEPLWPELYPTEALRKLQRYMDPSTIAGQYQQRPQSKTGGSFDISKLETVDLIPDGCVFVRAWDFAGTEGEGDWTVGALLALAPTGRVYICDIVRGQWRSDDVEEIVKLTAEMDGVSIPIAVPQDPGQAGKSQALYYVTKALPSYDVRIRRPTGSKTVRAGPLASQVRVGNVSIVRAGWNKDLTHEMHLFPKATWDDQIDAISDAYNELIENGGGFSVLVTKKTLLQLPKRIMGSGRIIEAEDRANKGLMGLLPKRKS